MTRSKSVYDSYCWIRDINQSIMVQSYSGTYSIRTALKTIVGRRFHLIEKRGQDVDEELLKTADILFIDSSHVSKIGSDVNFLMLDIVPQMKPGSVVHWHDILIPGDYWRN